MNSDHRTFGMAINPVCIPGSAEAAAANRIDFSCRGEPHLVQALALANGGGSTAARRLSNLSKISSTVVVSKSRDEQRLGVTREL